MAFSQLTSLSFVGLLFVAAAMSCATAIDIASPDGGLAGRKLLLQFRPKQPGPTHDNPLLQVSTEKKMCGKAPCPHPLPAPVDNGDTVVFLDGNNPFEGIIPGGKKPPIAIPPCQVGVCDQALVEEQDFDARHSDQQIDYSRPGPDPPSPDSDDHSDQQVDYSQPGPDPPSPDSDDHSDQQVDYSQPGPDPPSPDSYEHSYQHVDYSQPGPNPATPDNYDYPQLAAWSLKKESCLAHHKCSDPMKLCLNGLCVYPSHVDRVNKAVADERDFGARHINQVDYPQPAAWSMYDAVPCLAQCPNPMQVCFNGLCVDPPHVDSVNKGFNRGGAVIP